MLRRIAANLRRQDWTAVAIELAVVDVGTNIGNLTAYDADSLREGLRAIAKEAP